MEWISSHWELVAIAVLLVDKIVAITPTPWDDMIWTAIKGAWRGVVPGKKV